MSLICNVYAIFVQDKNFCRSVKMIFGNNQTFSSLQDFRVAFKEQQTEINNKIKELNDNKNGNECFGDYFYLVLKGNDSGEDIEYEGTINKEGKFETLQGLNAKYKCSLYKYKGKYNNNGEESSGEYTFNSCPDIFWEGKLQKDIDGKYCFAGKCVFYDYKNDIKYSGCLDKNFKKTGYGTTEYCKDEIIEEGEYEKGKRKGPFIIYDKKNNEIELCNFNNDIKYGYAIKAKLHKDNKINEISEEFYYANNWL